MKTIIYDIAKLQAKNLLNTGSNDNLPEDDLNPQQRSAVNCKSKIVYVNAGPGTGKTHLLTSKIVDYIQSSNTPQRIVALSYTNTAANHIGEKFKEKAEKCAISKEYTFYFGTIHSFCYSLLRAYNSTIKEVTEEIILDDEELHELAEEISIQLNKEYPVSDIESCLRAKKGTNDKLQEIINGYKTRYKVISIQDILANFIKAMEEDRNFQEWVKSQITAMAIDEAQDLSEENYIILELLLNTLPKLRLFLVGDPRQNIFEFNGGSFKHLENFLKRHEQHSTKHLTLTYRCGQNIADFVNGFHFNDCDNTQLKSMCDKAGNISLKKYPSEDAEAKAVTELVLSLGELSESAVLCNNLSYMTMLMRYLRAKSVPYRVLGGRKILKSHVRLLKHILRIIDNDNDYSIKKVAEAGGIVLHRQVGVKKTIKELFYESPIGIKIASIKDEYLITGQSLYALMINVLTQVMRTPEEGSEIADDYAKLLDMSQRYENISGFLLAFATDKDSFAEFYKKDYLECNIPLGDHYLTLSTIHSAKGLEWKNVFIIGLSEGNFPNSYFCQGLNQEQQKYYYNGELKKMYVASTRAKERLYLTYSTTLTRKGFTFSKLPSRFIKSLQLNS